VPAERGGAGRKLTQHGQGEAASAGQAMPTSEAAPARWVMSAGRGGTG
jgi:hypothetical protein